MSEQNGIIRRLWPVLRAILAGFGLLSLAAILALAFELWRSIETPNRTDKATARDVERVLNRIDQPSDTVVRVIGSFQSSRSFTGDHVDAICISTKNMRMRSEWKPMKDLDPSFQRAASMALETARQHLSCLPSDPVVERGDVLVRQLSVTFYGDVPNSAEMVFMDTTRNEAYYVSFSN